MELAPIFLGYPGSHGWPPDTIMEWKEFLVFTLQDLSERNREIFLQTARGATTRELSELYGVSRSRINQIQHKSLRHIKRREIQYRAKHGYKNP